MINKRQQLPPQIRKITVADRSSGKPVVRYQVTVDAGISPETGKRRQIRRRFATEKEARAELSQTQGGVSAGTYVHASKLTVEQACEAWLASKHSLKPSTLRGHRVSLQPLRDELGTVEVQRLSKANVDDLIARLRRGEVEGRRAWSARSCNYLRYLSSVVLDDQLQAGQRRAQRRGAGGPSRRGRQDVSHPDRRRDVHASSITSAATGTCGHWRSTAFAEVRSRVCGGPTST